MIKNYNQFLNESLLDELKGPSEEEVRNELNQLSGFDLLKSIINTGSESIIKEFLPKVDKKTLKTYIYNILIANIYQLNFETFKYLFEICITYDQEFIKIDSSHINLIFEIIIINKNKLFYDYLYEQGYKIKFEYFNNPYSIALRTSDLENQYNILNFLIMNNEHVQSDSSLIEFLYNENYTDLLMLLLSYNKVKIGDNELDIVMYDEELKDIFLEYKEKNINESLLDKLKGPSEEEVLRNISEMEPKDMLIKSAKIGYLDGVKKALSSVVGTSFRHFYGNDALRLAAEFGYFDIVKYLIEDLLKHKHDVDFIDYDNSIRFAVFNGHLDIVKYIIEMGVINSCNF